MKTRLWIVCCAIVFTISFGLLVGCGSKYDKVDDKDLTRWIVKFTSDYPSDISEEGIEYSLQTLRETNKNENDFTINIPYNPEYEEEAELDREFTLEPKTEFYYVDDEGQKVLVDSLNTEKDYYFMRDILYKADNYGEWHHCQRVWGIGEYRLDYVFGTNLNAVGMPNDTIWHFWIKIIVKNIEEN